MTNTEMAMAIANKIESLRKMSFLHPELGHGLLRTTGYYDHVFLFDDQQVAFPGSATQTILDALKSLGWDKV